jgi:uncharacterized protein (DUF2147 family)
MACWSTASLADEGSPHGLWLTEKGDARIQVAQCGRAICGKVAWLREAIDPATGRPQTDDKNWILRWPRVR